VSNVIRSIKRALNPPISGYAKDAARRKALGGVTVKRVVDYATGAPPALPRPAGMTRQQHRRLYRETCKLAGLPWRKEQR